MSGELVIERDPSPLDVQYLEDRLYEFNAGATGVADGDGLAIFVRDDGGRIVAAIAGYTWGNFCEIRQLWIEPSRRRQGMGTRLLSAAEAEARRRGCDRIVLTTYSFQAPDFYRKHGFAIVAVADDQPRGHQHLLLRKALA
jgi:GNAT superfamily N-acetyltransferase